MQSRDTAQLVYEDFVERIGCDASKYRYTSDGLKRIFTWCDEETGTDYIAIVFTMDEKGVWRCSSHQAVFPSDLVP